MLEQLNSVFFDEANELLDNLEEQLLALSDNPSDSETISAVFRAMHTIKGSAAMFGFNDISSVTHEIESAMDQVRNGIIPVTPELIDLLLKARDHIRLMLEAGAEVPENIKTASEDLVLEFKVYISKHGGSSAESASVTQKKVQAQLASAASATENNSSYRIKFRPSRNIMQNGTRPELLVKELAELGTATITAFHDDLPELSKLDEEACYFMWDIVLTTTKTENDIKDVFIFLDSESKFEVEKIDFEANTKIGEILVDRGNVSQTHLDKVLNAQKPLGELLVDEHIVTTEQVQSALAEQKHLRSLSPTGQPQSGAPQQTVRISSTKLDELVNLVGELVTFNARLEQQAIKTESISLKNLSEQCERISIMLRDSSMGLRMVPISTLFTRFRRTVHDLANQLGKSIELIMEGAETELDKTVIEKLNDPLLHLIRNSVDHGIELPTERIASKKEPMGHVTLSAKHVGAFILITISDDGRGLDKDAVRAKGIQKGIISEKDNLSEYEIYNLIFQPGFSTAKEVTSISGRGVGLDVVKKDLASLGGSVSVETTKGQGTSFVLKIPLTLAIIDGMLTSINNIKYIVPLNTIAECMTFQADPKHKNDLILNTTLHGKEIKCINLRKFFGVESDYPVKQEIVSVYDNDRIIGLAVDKILGSNQTVIKPLGRLFNNCTGINGSSILGDGSVALILDVLKLTDLLHKIEKEME